MCLSWPVILETSAARAILFGESEAAASAPIDVGYSGQNQLIAALDSVIDRNHGAFGNRAVEDNGLPNDQDSDGHGTHVAGCMVGQGFRHSATGLVEHLKGKSHSFSTLCPVTTKRSGTAPNARVFVQSMQIAPGGILEEVELDVKLESAQNKGKLSQCLSFPHSPVSGVPQASCFERHKVKDRHRFRCVHHKHVMGSQLVHIARRV